MKSCPTCNRTYPDDTLAFCLMDGSVLSAPYDPSETRAASPRSNEPPPTEVISAPAKPAEARAPLQSTIRAPVPQVPDLRAARTAAKTIEEPIGVPLLFRLPLAARGILAALCIIPWIFIRHGGLLWNMYPLFAGILTLTAGISMFVKSRKGVLLMLDSAIALIIALVFFVSSQWLYWLGTWPIVSGTLLIATAIEMRKRVSRTWLLALAGLIFGIYSVIFYILLKAPFTDFSFSAFTYVRAGTAFLHGLILTVFALGTRGRLPSPEC